MSTVPVINGNANTGFPLRDSLYVSKSKSTFCNDDSLPNLPVPSLEQTIEKYLDSVKAVVTEEEYKRTQEICQEFQNGVGKELQLKLLQRAKNHRNWLEKWWEDMAYLQQRTALIPMCNMAGVADDLDTIWPYESGKQVEYASMFLYFQLCFWKLLRRERLKPHYQHEVPWTMHQFRRLFNTARVPGETIDKIVSHFRTESEDPVCPSHVVVFHQGHIFTFDPLDESGEVLKPPQLALQLQRIKDYASVNGFGSAVASLTAADRSEWAKNMDWLVKIHPENAQNLEIINSSMLGVCLDDSEPKDPSEAFKLMLSGDCSNRWADKSALAVIFNNGAFGLLSEHSAIDGTVTVGIGHYAYASIVESGGKWKESDTVEREIPPPQSIDFHIDDRIKTAIKSTRDSFKIMAEDVDAILYEFKYYGKALIKTFKIHPEIYIQLALEYAYYLMHGKFAPTYVTASTRQFYHGRTETIRACYPEMVEWITAMTEDTKNDCEKLKLLHKAADKFKILLKDCMRNHGCDRHLMGLYMIATEENIPIPEIFIDPSWVKSGGSGNFILSTSCSGYTPVGGGVMPMREDGYGVFYNIIDNLIRIRLTAFKHCPETDTTKFSQHIEKALLALERMMTSSKPCPDLEKCSENIR